MIKKMPLIPPSDGAATEVSVRYYRTWAGRFRRAKVIILIVALAFTGLMTLFLRDSINYENFLFLVRDLDAEYGADIDGAGIGVTYDADTEMTCRVFRKHLIVVDTASITLFGLTGYGVFSYPHEYLHPAVSVSDRFFIVYDLGGYHYSVYNAVGCLYASETTDFPITDACIADNGTYAIVTRSRTYCSTVKLYSDNFRLLASYNTMRYVTGAALSSGAGSLYVVSAYVESGVPRAVLQCYEAGSETERYKIEYPSGGSQTQLFTAAVIPLKIGLTGDKTPAVICDTGVMFCTSGGDLDMFYSFVGNLPAGVGKLSTAAFGNGQLALLFTDEVGEGTVHLCVLRDDGTPLFRDLPVISVSDRVTRMAYSNSTLFLLSSTYVYRLEKSGKLTSIPLTGNGEILSFEGYDTDTAIISYTDRTVSIRFR